jgi:mRNA interferase MazF
MSYPKRGDIYWVKLDPTVGAEIKKTRPAVIVSNDIGNQYANLVIVAPIASTSKKNFSFTVPIVLEKVEGTILLNQIKAIDKSSIGKQIGMCEMKTIDQIDKALKVVLDLD